MQQDTGSLEKEVQVRAEHRAGAGQGKTERGRGAPGGAGCVESHLAGGRGVGREGGHFYFFLTLS